METTQENWKHFILHLYKGLADELLGSYTSKERDKEIERLNSTHDEVYHYFIPISIQGEIQKLVVEGLYWNEETEKEKIKITPAMKNLKGIHHISLQDILTQHVYDMSNGYFSPQGKVGVEPETWAIDCYWDGEVFETFLYQSKHEYESDIETLSPKKESPAEGYTFINCSICNKDFKKDATDFLLGLTDEANTICPKCTDSEKEPNVFINFYQCVCGKEWESVWSCACNSKCPECNSEIEPHQTEDIPPAKNKGYADMVLRRDVEGVFNPDSEDTILVCLSEDVKWLEERYKQLLIDKYHATKSIISTHYGKH